MHDTHAARRAGSTWPRQPRVLAAVAAGGALGAPARYGVSQLLTPAHASRTPGMPWATLAINVSGSFALAFLVVTLAAHRPHWHLARPLLGTGFLGAYTTYSTFAVETDRLVQHGRLAIAGCYVAASFALGFAAVRAGARTGTATAPAPAPSRVDGAP